MTTLSSMHAGGSLGPHGAPPGIENRSVGGSLKPIPGLGEGQRLGGGGGANSAAKPKKTKRCGECPGCRHDVREDCGECLNCLDKPKFGGANQRKQACVKRTCTNPQPNPEYYASLPGAAAAAAAAAVAAGGSGGRQPGRVHLPCMPRQAPRTHVRQERDEQLPRPQGRRRPLWTHAARAALAVSLHLP